MNWIKKYWKYLLAGLAIVAAVVLTIIWRRQADSETDAQIQQREEEIKEIEQKVTTTQAEKKESLDKIDKLKKEVEEIRKKKQEQAVVEGDPVAFLRDFANKKIEEAKGE